ncbi:hypothetical protein AMET1_0541 [Methanonatronarchaeum thermophilum]|uniref:Uncharacterized protein n=1 Tax=Methanonatronarchaeum thermophilum TaxID=1927129 RepID=A0A1Y3GCC3_9EURY|nr:hypothetical protein [Methanonatronarchaeum thermophilum]OUJ18890.1 hypothetical protein AMET1_0541 [Methanonatronarchaeum thermophilum]
MFIIDFLGVMIESIVNNPLAAVTALATLFYASVLFWERWTDKPDLKIKEISLEMLENKGHISVHIDNEGRRTANDALGYLEVLDENDDNVELNHPDFREVSKKKISMIWVPNMIGTRKAYKGEIGDKDVKIKEPWKVYPELTKTDIGAGGHGFLRLSRPLGAGLLDVFENLEDGNKYRFKVTVRTAKSKDEKTKEAVYPNDFQKTYFFD